MSRSKLIYLYAKKRRDFGRQPLFQNVQPHIVDSIPPDIQQQKEYVLRNPVHREVQAVLPQSECEMNTNPLVMQDTGINHTEGGWPKDVNIFNEEHTDRHRRRVLHDEHYIHSVSVTSPFLNHCINQNNAIEMYQTYYSEIPPQPKVETYNVRIANVFRNNESLPVSCIDWTIEDNPKLAVSYCKQEHESFKESPEHNNYSIYLWDIHMQTEPLLKIKTEFACWQLACSPAEPEIMIAGQGNGTVSLVDTRAHKYLVSNSSCFNSHRDSVTSILYTQSRTNTTFFSGSSDGQCMWWDTRNLSEPTETLSMSIKIGNNVKPTPSNAEGISALQFERQLQTRFLCGTESGYVINVNRMGKTRSEILSSYWNCHNGPVKAVHRSPCTSRMFITCGDWSVRIWSEEVHMSPIIVTKPYKFPVNDVAWAPNRFSSFMSVCEGGYFYYWDLLRKPSCATAKHLISKNPLTKLKPESNGNGVAVGGVKGSVYLLELSQNMVFPEQHDRQLMHELYQRETQREHILENRVREIRLKQRDEEKAMLEALQNQEVEPEEDILEVTENEYFKIVKEELAKL